jgi:hypothetical protein
LDVFFVNDLDEAAENAYLDQKDQEVAKYHEREMLI